MIMKRCSEKDMKHEMYLFYYIVTIADKYKKGKGEESS